MSTQSYSVEFGFLADDPPEDARTLTRYFFPCKFGGRPAWLIPERHPTDLDCSCCGNRMKFLLQIYASRENACSSNNPDGTGPLSDSPAFHRTLFVFTCVRKSCKSEFRVFRAQLPKENPYCILLISFSYI